MSCTLCLIKFIGTIHISATVYINLGLYPIYVQFAVVPLTRIVDSSRHLCVIWLMCLQNSVEHELFVYFAFEIKNVFSSCWFILNYSYANTIHNKHCLQNSPYGLLYCLLLISCMQVTFYPRAHLFKYSWLLFTGTANNGTFSSGF